MDMEEIHMSNFNLQKIHTTIIKLIISVNWESFLLATCEICTYKYILKIKIKIQLFGKKQIKGKTTTFTTMPTYRQNRLRCF